MLQFRSGSRDAFDELFARYRQIVYGFFRRRTEDRTRAEDLTQETFLAVLRATERYEPRSTVRSYLFGIAYKLLSAERRKVSHQAGPAREAARPDPTEAALWFGRPWRSWIRKSARLLMLREYEQLSYEEIAALLKIPLNTVRSRFVPVEDGAEGVPGTCGKGGIQCLRRAIRLNRRI